MLNYNKLKYPNINKYNMKVKLCKWQGGNLKAI